MVCSTGLYQSILGLWHIVVGNWYLIHPLYWAPLLRTGLCWHCTRWVTGTGTETNVVNSAANCNFFIIIVFLLLQNLVSLLISWHSLMLQIEVAVFIIYGSSESCILKLNITISWRILVFFFSVSLHPTGRTSTWLKLMCWYDIYSFIQFMTSCICWSNVYILVSHINLSSLTSFRFFF